MCVNHTRLCQDKEVLNNTLSAFDTNSPELSRSSQTKLDLSQDLNDCSPALMQSDTWGAVAHLTPKVGRFSHQRESSLSSLGSTGPASPFNQNISNPHIVMTDPNFEGGPEMHPQEFANSQINTYYQLAKSMGSAPQAGYQCINNTVPDMAYPVPIPGPEKKYLDKGILPTPDFTGTYAARSHPASVASSVRGDSPATPSMGEIDQGHHRRNGYNNHIPKLDRTMTDVYGDELYNPNFAITSTPSPQPHSHASSKGDIFSQRINAANCQHLSATQSPVSTDSRARSPFRTDSSFSTSPARGLAASHQFTSTGHWREQDQTTQRSLPQLEGAGEPETPETISPKDAVLEFNESETDGMFPLFPQDSSNFEIGSLSKAINTQSPDDVFRGLNSANLQSQDQLGYLPSQLPTGISVPQQYPFVAQPSANRDSPPRLSSSGASSLVDGVNTPTDCGRPMKTGADSGTYTCTYHGCALRFETPTLLQKHKREGHRQTQSLGTTRVQDIGMASSISNSQAGPHRCDRINPSTGKSCNTVFSRPYDLTRHEDTIHNARKQKVRCNLCTEEKTFSRADALTRHYRVCHPDMDLQGRTRRRGAA
ncbi:hypothetical protein QQS21_001145 [Conoideocrella luteorostrata]|uniref:C2H2-type domain-containing protein n=1 Tax=Conoideocrella luteorostrata TaxID=1105319 RepID=A0AAJ0CXQ5_9HYPO|nr:hypothetical protein QQS21_001145 [Conoideocrella luteorostrata]